MWFSGIGYYASFKENISSISNKKRGSLYYWHFENFEEKTKPVSFGQERFNINICYKSNAYFNIL